MTFIEHMQKKNKWESPAYYFDLDKFKDRVDLLCKKLPHIPLTYSIKANPFLLCNLPEKLSHVEACSPGELQICKFHGIPGRKIIYSGVNKGKEDIKEAIEYGVDIVTAESVLHAELEQEMAAILGKKQDVILRLTSGNQFGMSEEDIFAIISNKNKYSSLNFVGIHYYSGTQKKTRQIEKDINKLNVFLERAAKEYEFVPQLVEVGPGLAAEYFPDGRVSCDGKEENYLCEVIPLLLGFAKKYPLGIELGRFLAASCGTYATRVADVKTSMDTNYLICDGGIHQLKYYGQTMAMQIPEMEAVVENATKKQLYCVCGSLCTTADILVREVKLPQMKVDDVLLFHRCGAYSITEGSALFLSRQFPSVYVYSSADGLVKIRNEIESALINRGNYL